MVDVGHEIVEWDAERKEVVVRVDGDGDEMMREVFED